MKKTPTEPEVLVWDPWLRGFHWLLASAFILADQSAGPLAPLAGWRRKNGWKGCTRPCPISAWRRFLCI